MTSRIGYLASTIGKKQIMALGGLGLCLFVLSHVLGNFLLFVGPEAYNMYSYKLTSNPLIYVAEIGLIALFASHVVSGFCMTLKNRASKPVTYAKPGSGDKKTSAATKSMWWQGVVVFVFVVLHLVTFKFGPHYEVQYGSLVVRDIFRLVLEVFQSPGYVVWYVIAVLILSVHLSHGFQSSLQSLGLHHPRYTPKIKAASVVYGLIVGLGFAAQPIYMLLAAKG